MKMIKKTGAALLLVTSLTTGAFIYGSGITQRSDSEIKPNQKGIVYGPAVERDIFKPVIIESTQKEQVAPPVEVKPAPVKKTTTAAAPKKSTTTVSRGGTAAKRSTTTTTTKSAAYTTVAYSASSAERDLFYRLVSAESAGESLAGKLAVATVIMNRVKSGDFPNTITGVINDRNWGVQFTPTADGRINEPATAEAKKAVDMVLAGHRSFESKVLFFMNPSKSVNMYVVNNRTYYTTIGSHKFYY
jgi:spore germination cell wall hydrolase CwlJ-like protein